MVDYQIHSVRLLADVVARRGIVAGDEPPAIVAPNPSAPHLHRVPPHHLRVVPALLPRRARVRVVVVERLLRHPQVHRRLPREVATAFRQVLPVLPAAARVHEIAVADPLVGVVPGEGRHGFVPGDRPDAHLGTGGVVGVHVVLRRVLRLGGMDCCQHREKNKSQRHRAHRQLHCSCFFFSFFFSVEGWIEEEKQQLGIYIQGSRYMVWKIISDEETQKFPMNINNMLGKKSRRR